jgi:hypothetical protein
MAQGIIKFGKIVLIVGLVYFALWAAGQMGFKDVIIYSASMMPGLHDLPEKYQLGIKRSALLEERTQKLDDREKLLDAKQAEIDKYAEREAKLKRREDQLKEDRYKLMADRRRLQDDQKKLLTDQKKLDKAESDFAFRQNKWLDEHPGGLPKKNGQSDYVAVPGNVNPPITSDSKIKEYLTMLGKMKPKQAAMIIQKLPEETVFTIFDQLNQYQVIKIMENLPEDYLAKLTQDRLNKYRNF